VLGVGVAFKPGVDDLRESPSLLVLDRLARRGAEVSFHDSFVPRCEIDGEVRESVLLDAGTVARQDIVVLLTPHPDVDVHALVNTAALDARGVTMGIDAPNVVRL
jgi:UDP-N-acetyl-D-glucosamine dehydrogenase